MDINKQSLEYVGVQLGSLIITRRGGRTYFKDDTLGEQWLNARSDEERLAIETRARHMLTPEKEIVSCNRKCKYCGTNFPGRKAQIFCSTKCRDAGFVRLQAPQRRLVYNVEDILNATGSLSEIALRFGISKTHVGRIRQTGGAVKKPYIPVEKELVIASAEGTLKSIALKYGVAVSTVHRLKKKKGPDPSGSSPPFKSPSSTTTDCR